MPQDCCKTIEVKEHPSLTRAVLQAVNFLLHWISVFTPHLTHKKQQEYGRRKDFF